MSSPARNQVFISYSHADAEWLKRLRTHLTPFERKHGIKIWDDTQISPGARWRDDIEAALRSTKVAVLLVSPNYLHSNFIDTDELPELLEAAEGEGLRIVWVALSPSAYGETAIAKYQAAHNPAEPLDGLEPSKCNAVLVKVCEAIKSAMTEPATAAVEARHADTPADERATRAPTKRTRTKLYLAVACGVLAVAALAVAVALSTRRGAVKAVVLDDEFLNLDKWTTPESGWLINPDEGASRLEVEGQPQLGFATGVAYRDFEMCFNLKPLNDAGATWALRVNGPEDYYLFHLTGPGGKPRNRFLSFVVRGGKLGPEKSTPIAGELKAGEQYYVLVRAAGNKITHFITLDDGVTTRLGDFEDDTFPQGGIGFRTVSGEKFSVDDLFAGPQACSTTPPPQGDSPPATTP